MLLAVITLTVIMVPYVHAEDIVFNESSTHHKPVLHWIGGLTQPTYPYACGYLSTTPHEEDLYYDDPGVFGDSCKWTVEATKVTVSFPETPNPSVIGDNNWLAAGMFVTGWDHTVDQQDWAYYSVLVLDRQGNLWLDVGIYADNEVNGVYYEICTKTWHILGVDRSTPTTLTARWIGETVDWDVTIAGAPYNPPNSSFDMSNQVDPIESFAVGWENILPFNPHPLCYYFQFGITSPNHITQGGWNALIEYPQWYKDGEWHLVQQAQTMQGENSWLDNVWCWGGANAYVEVKCHNNDPSMERYKIKFYHWYPELASNYYLWSHEPETPPAPSGPASGYTGVQMCYTACTTDPESTVIQYLFAWGDGKYDAMFYWLPSGTTLGFWHAWANTGTYQVQVCAFDCQGKQSQWSPPLAVTVSKPHGTPGGCPFAFTWNGTSYLLDNNLLPASESINGTDIADYYLLQQKLVQRPDGTLSLLLSEFENEHSFLDQTQLLAVDHLSNVNVAVSPNGEILTYTDPSPPVSAINNNNQNVKHLLNSIDGNFYEGYIGSYVTLNFGDFDVTQGAKLVLRADWAKRSIHIQVQDSNNNWITVATVIPRINWATEIIDMSHYLPDVKGNLKIRLYFTANHKLDFVGLDTSPQATIDAHEGQLVSATHSAQGDINSKLLYGDAIYAEMMPRQSIELIFTLPQQTMEKRNYIIITEGHYTTP